MKKVGIVFVSHARIAEEMIRVTEDILKEPLPIIPVCVLNSDEADYYRSCILQAIAQANQGAGVLILSDVFGGTPANLCLPFLKKGEVELVTGINLPILLKLGTLKESLSLLELVSFIEQYGKRHIQSV